jgi:hypothetical protein
MISSFSRVRANTRIFVRDTFNLNKCRKDEVDMLSQVVKRTSFFGVLYLNWMLVSAPCHSWAQ